MERVESSSSFETLRHANDALLERAPLLIKFERGVALSEELDRIYLGVVPDEQVPSIETAELRSQVERILSDCTPLERLALGMELNREFDAIRRSIFPQEQDQVNDPSQERKITYQDYLELRERAGVGTAQAWSHGWNKAKAMGLVDQMDMLSIDSLKEVTKKRERFIAPGVGKATLMVYSAVIDHDQTL